MLGNVGKLSGTQNEAELLSYAGEWTLKFTRELDHPVDEVWAVLTDPAVLRTWAPYTADRDLAAEGDVLLTMLGESPDEDEALPSTVTRALAPHLLVLTWGPDLLHWELQHLDDPEPAGTRLILRHTIEDRQMLSAVTAGWHLCLDAAGAVLRGTPGPPVVGRRARDFGWEELNQRYATVLGVRPATVW